MSKEYYAKYMQAGDDRHIRYSTVDPVHVVS